MPDKNSSVSRDTEEILFILQRTLKTTVFLTPKQSLNSDIVYILLPYIFARHTVSNKINATETEVIRNRNKQTKHLS